MKKAIISAVTAATIALAGSMSAAEKTPDVPSIPEIRLQWNETAPECLLTAKNAGPETSFQVKLNGAQGLEIKITAELAQAKSELAGGEDTIYVFFEGCKPAVGEAYCNIFGPVDCPAALHTDLFYYSSDGEICNHTPDIRIRPEKAESGKSVFTVLIPWQDVARMLPFAPGKGKKEWQFTVIRSILKFTATWQGDVHSPKTWGKLILPEFTDSQKAEICRQIIRANARNGVVFDRDYCTKESFDKTKAVRENALKELAEKSAKASVTLAELQKWADQSVGLTEFRTIVPWDKLDVKTDALPLSEEWITLRSAKLGHAYNDLRILHFTAAQPGPFQVQLRNSGGIRKTFAMSPAKDGAQHFVIGKTEAGDVLELRAPAKDLKSLKSVKDLKLHFVLADIKNGLEPEAPCNRWEPEILSHQAGCGYGGTPHPNFVNLSRTYAERYAAEKGNTVMLGDSITQYFTGFPAWNRLKALGVVNAGVEGDVVQGTAWRADHADFEAVQPKYFIILIGTNNLVVNKATEEKIAEAVYELAQSLVKRCPQSKVIILSVLPRGGKLFEQVQKINAKLAVLATGKQIIYKDVSKSFLLPDGKLDNICFSDGLHPSQAGYTRFLDDFIPYFQKLRGF